MRMLSIQRSDTPAASQSEAGNTTRSWSLKDHFLFFGFILVLPLALLAASLIFEVARTHRAQLEQRMVQLAAAIAADVDREFQRRITMLQTLASSPALPRGDLATFHAHASAALREDKAGIFLIDPSSLQQLVNTYTSFGVELPRYGSPETAQRVLQAKTWQISDFFIGRVSRRPAFDVVIPILERQEVRYILAMGLEPFMLQEIMQEQKLPTEWVLTIADRNGTIIARSIDPDKNVGAKLPAAFSAQKAGTVERTRNLEGTAVLRATAVTELSGWQAAVNLPEAVAEGPLKQSLVLLVLWSVAALLLAALLANWFARTIAHPITVAAHAAAGLADRQDVPPLHSHISEANDLIAALRRAAEELSRTEETRRSAEERQCVALGQLQQEKVRTEGLAQQREAVFQAIPNGVLAADGDGRIQLLNGQLAGRFGYRREELLGKPVEILVPVRFRENHVGLRAAFAAQPSPRPMGAGRDLYGLCKDGSEFPIEIGLSPFTADGRQMVLAVIIDITERKRAEQTEKLLAAELQHRTKNLLAIMQALAVRSLRGDHSLDQAREAFLGRLHALARNDQRLTDSAWNGTSLNEVVRSELEPFAGRIKIEGADVMLSPQAAQNFALVIHELGTNAVKYGALSKSEGEIEVAWTIATGGADGVLKFRWRERGGPAVLRPAHMGFGMSLLKSVLGAARIEYPPEGLTYEVELLLENIAPRPMFSPFAA